MPLGIFKSGKSRTVLAPAIAKHYNDQSFTAEDENRSNFDHHTRKIQDTVYEYYAYC